MFRHRADQALSRNQQGLTKVGSAGAPAFGSPNPVTCWGRVGETLREKSSLIWDDQQRPRRGPRPALSRSDMVQAAICMSVGGGLAALTMRAVAQRLGFTTMAPCRYVPTKATLIDACVASALGAPQATGGMGQGRRSDVKQGGPAKRAMSCARPWQEMSAWWSGDRYWPGNGHMVSVRKLQDLKHHPSGMVPRLLPIDMPRESGPNGRTINLIELLV